MLAPGGIVGIRVRNLAGQLWLCRCFSRPGLARAGINPFTLSPLHFYAAGHRADAGPPRVRRIECQNSPFTQGNPYAYGRSGALAACREIMAVAAWRGLVFRISHAG